MKNKSLIVFVGFLISFQVQAGSLYCEGEVKHVAYHGNGKFMLQLSSMNNPVFFCSPIRIGRFQEPLTSRRLKHAK